MKQIIIGIDVDDVIANLMSRWLEYYNFDHEDNLKEQDIKSWAISKYTKIGDSIYDYLKLPSLYDDIHPVSNSVWGISCLRKMSFKIVFITASTPEQSGRKYKWLCDYSIIEHRKEYIEALDKSLVKVDYLIDDNPENVVNASGQGIVFTKEWNKTLAGYPRMNNWSDIVSYFVCVANQREIAGV
jgi:5'(3')-deoxyribonucleotidase